MIHVSSRPGGVPRLTARKPFRRNPINPAPGSSPKISPTRHLAARLRRDTPSRRLPLAPGQRRRWARRRWRGLSVLDLHRQRLHPGDQPPERALPSATFRPPSPRAKTTGSFAGSPAAARTCSTLVQMTPRTHGNTGCLTHSWFHAQNIRGSRRVITARSPTPHVEPHGRLRASATSCLRASPWTYPLP